MSVSIVSDLFKHYLGLVICEYVVKYLGIDVVT